MKKGLGKGLEALFSIYDEENEKEEKPVSKTADNIKENNDGDLEIAIEEIRPNPNQPRKNFDQRRRRLYDNCRRKTLQSCQACRT